MNNTAALHAADNVTGDLVIATGSYRHGFTRRPSLASSRKGIYTLRIIRAAQALPPIRSRSERYATRIVVLRPLSPSLESYFASSFGIGANYSEAGKHGQIGQRLGASTSSRKITIEKPRRG